MKPSAAGDSESGEASPAVRPKHGEEVRALDLLLQHRKLLRALDELDAQLEGLRLQALQTAGCPESAKMALAASLRTFAQHLAEHFAAEARSTADVFAGSASPRISSLLAELESEHPRLRKRFEGISRDLESGKALNGALVADLQGAIDAFRSHEEREDRLFTQS